MSTQAELAEQHKNGRLAGRTLKKLTKDQKIAQMRMQFAFFDIDQSGSLSAKEFLNILRQRFLRDRFLLHSEGLRIIRHRLRGCDLKLLWILLRLA